MVKPTMKLFWLFVVLAVIAFVAAGFTTLYGKQRLGIIFGAVSLLCGLISGHSWYAAKRSNAMLEFKDSEFSADIEDADRASAMEVNQPATFSGVKATLKAKNVKDAAGFRTNQGIVSIAMTCPVTGQPVSFVMTGQPDQAPEMFTCPRCGQQHPLKIK